MKIAAIFGPQHGLFGHTQDNMIEWEGRVRGGIPVHSLYGERREPTDEMLREVDLLVVDLPFMSYQEGPSQALRSAGRLMKEAGAEAVKLEGGAELAPSLRLLRQAGIPVMGHLGLTPQSVHALGGYRIQGRERAAAARLLADAKVLQAAGAFAIVLEGLPASLAKRIGKALKVPTIGIGAGPHCDGQVQVWHDLHGALPGRRPRHARAFQDGFGAAVQALKAYRAALRSGAFPSASESPA